MVCPTMYRLLILFGLILVAACHCTADESLRTKVLKEGMGPPVTEGQEAVISYRLTLEDGTLVESTESIKPYRFELGSGSVIPGMSKGVLGMKVAEQREVRVPAALAYGEKGVGPIPPNATLIFEITLLEIKEPKAEPELSDQMQDDEFLARRHAKNISKPAIFEYLIRDFFTKPWRYSDGHLKIWKETTKLAFAFVLLLIGYGLGKKKGFFIP